MNSTVDNQRHFSSVCIEKCKGLCCGPWWGIISYTMAKANGLDALDGFRGQVIKGIRQRQDRITDAYVTNERPGRALFKNPERYNVTVTGVKKSGSSLEIGILAMFAFRCLYLSKEGGCLIHPSVLGATVLGAKEIRPPHCAALGSPESRPNEKGYCRVIHAARRPDANDAIITEAIDAEKNISLRAYQKGVATIEAAADNVISSIRDYCSDNSAGMPLEKTQAALGRNDPCWCGSNIKFKKCHGK